MPTRTEPAGQGSWELCEQAGIRWLETPVGFGTARFTLASTGGGERLNLGATPEGLEAATAARLSMVRAMGLEPERFRLVRQVHGGNLRQTGRLPSGGAGELIPAREPAVEADGLVSQSLDEILMILVADCLPLALAGDGGLALLHLGWRGLATGMLEEASTAIGASEAAIGPCVGPCCYEVGSEVSEALGVELSPAGTVDLAAITTERLLASGVESVKSAERCTSCEAGTFFSYRKQGAGAGRQAALLFTL
ncbi:MAG: polyphenol oxidase family protein [Solirubrobacterales bacterium]